jgi:hypothetical protein
MTKRWTFHTAKLTVTLETERVHGYQYDGDDEDGQTQAMLDSGEYVAFDSRVTVSLTSDPDIILGEDHLGSSVYCRDTMSDFWKGHRDPDPKNRNCSIGTAARGYPAVICHYFPEMVRIAISEARKALPRVTR